MTNVEKCKAMQRKVREALNQREVEQAPLRFEFMSSEQLQAELGVWRAREGAEQIRDVLNELSDALDYVSAQEGHEPPSPYEYSANELHDMMARKREELTAVLARLKDAEEALESVTLQPQPSAAQPRAGLN